jgi:prefoldin subunit 5
LSSIDRLTKQVADLTEYNKKLQQQIEELLKQIK